MSDAFVSYARDDDEAFVKRLYADLTDGSICVWWDRKAMESRGLTFLQEIRDVIALVDRVVLVVGPSAVKSEYVQVEWEFALELCKAVVPLLRLGPEGAIPSVLRREDFALIPSEPSTFHVPDFRSDAAYSTALNADSYPRDAGRAPRLHIGRGSSAASPMIRPRPKQSEPASNYKSSRGQGQQYRDQSHPWPQEPSPCPIAVERRTHEVIRLNSQARWAHCC